MKIAIIDADLVGRKKHRFPNLACMKMSGYYKSLGHDVLLKVDYEDLEVFDKVFISKVFTDTPIDENILKQPYVEYGGTGFFYDKATPLPYEIEHSMPDYHLYDKWVEEKIANGADKKELEYYQHFSIGFTTRGCFRKCPFCVNKNYNIVKVHSPLTEFVDPTRKYICLLDDNILGYSEWKEIFHQLALTKKGFQYKQGMDERLLTKEKVEIIASSKYKDTITFAFDDISDKDIIISKLKLWREGCKRRTKFYVFCGFDRQDKWDKEFWKQDIVDTFERIKILMSYGCQSYIMRFNRYEESPYRGIYINLARWCNQPNMYERQSFREWCESVPPNKKGDSVALKYMKEFEALHPEVAKEYFDLKYKDLNTNRG